MNEKIISRNISKFDDVWQQGSVDSDQKAREEGGSLLTSTLRLSLDRGAYMIVMARCRYQVGRHTA